MMPSQTDLRSCVYISEFFNIVHYEKLHKTFNVAYLYESFAVNLSNKTCISYNEYNISSSSTVVPQSPKTQPRLVLLRLRHALD